MAEISPFRRYWALKPGMAFLNHGSFGACPKPILALQQELRRKMKAEPARFLWRDYEQRLDPARAGVAAFVGARSRDVVFVPNATTVVNAVLRSLKLRPGDELLTTCHDYNACRNALVQRAREARTKVVVARVPFPIRHPGEATEAVLRLCDRFGVEVPFFRLGEPTRRYFRISAQLYNSMEDYERLAEALKVP